MRVHLLLLLLLILPVASAHAQGEKLIIRFSDAATNAPVNDVRIIDFTGHTVATGDTAGYLVIAFDPANLKGKIIAVADGYKPDTLYSIPGIIYLKPLSVSLSTATVSSSRTRHLLHAPNEYVVDYAINGKNIIAASYSGGNGSKAKVLLLDMDGKIITQCPLPAEPLGIYKSCIGNYYCVCANEFFPLEIKDSAVAVRKPYPIKMLAGLQQCTLTLHGNRYYMIGDHNNFTVTYGMIKEGHSVFTPFREFEEREVAKANLDEYMEILALLEFGQWKEAARRDALRLMWNKGSYAHISMPLYTCGDSLLIFDYFKKAILFYTSDGSPAGICPIRFDWPAFQQLSIIADEADGKLYVHRYANKNKQTIELLDVKNGITQGDKITIDNPLAEQVKIYNGNIYFLWNAKAGATRQLYIQRMD